MDEWLPPPLVPRTPFREVCWRLSGATNKIMTCTIETHVRGLEVRMGYSEDHIIETRPARDLNRRSHLRGEGAPDPRGSGLRRPYKEPINKEKTCARSVNCGLRKVTPRATGR